MSNTLKFGAGEWAVKEGSTLAYNDENGNFKPLPFTFDRAGSATRVNKQGLIEVVSNNEPRVDFLNDSKGALLLEPSRTNLITYSEDFSGWVAGYLYITPNYAISPDGTQNASRCLFTGSNQLISTPTSATGTLTGSIYIKGVSGETIQLAAGGGEDLITLNGDWQRLIVTKENINGTFNINTFGGATARDLLIWGAQLEQGSYATSYIPTSGSSVTRAAETCNGAGDANTFNDSEGVLFAEISALADGGSTRRWSISDGSYSNRITLELDEASNTLKAFVISADTISYSPSEVLSDITNYNKVAIKYKQNDFALWINGFEFDVDNSGDTPINLSKMQLADGNGTDAPFYGNIKQIQYFDKALTDAELKALTQV